MTNPLTDTRQQVNMMLRLIEDCDSFEKFLYLKAMVAGREVEDYSDWQCRWVETPDKISIEMERPPLETPVKDPGYEYTENSHFVEWITMDMLDAIPMVEYDFRGKKMKRAPKREFYYPGEQKTYKWGQEKSNYPGGDQYTGLPMPPWMENICDALRRQTNERPNHAILIKYEDGVKNHAPPHQDKLDKAGKYGFFNFSFGEPRRFELRKGPKPDSELEWGQYLADHSCLFVSGKANQEFYHSVPKDKDHTGTRYSLIFRTII